MLEFLGMAGVIVLVIVVVIIMFAAILSQVIGVPGNWIGLVILVIYKLVGPNVSTDGVSWKFILVMAAFALVGELLEWVIQVKAGRKFGSSGKGDIGGIVGSIIGGILLLPLFFGFGAVLGALAGAYVGCLVVELARRRTVKAANKAAWGAFVGRFLGMGLKLGIGIGILGMTAIRMWP